MTTSMKSQDKYEIHNIPMTVVNRPIPSVLDNEKVEQFVEGLTAGDDFPAIDVLEVEDKGQTYYFAFGGCHRWAAHKQLKRDTIKAKIIPASADILSIHMGGSNPFKK